MAPALTPAGGRDPCGAGEHRGVCPRALPRLPSPLPGGRESSARSCEAARCDFGNVGPCSHLSARGGSGWFVLSWMLAGFLHSRHGIITIAECHHRFGSSARQAGHIRDLGAPWLWRGCPAPRDERSGTARGRAAKRLRFAQRGLQRSRRRLLLRASGKSPSCSRGGGCCQGAFR